MQILGIMPNCTLNQVAVQLVGPQDPAGAADTVWFLCASSHRGVAATCRANAASAGSTRGKARADECKRDGRPVCSDAPIEIYGIEAVQITGRGSDAARSDAARRRAGGGASTRAGGGATCADPSVQKASWAITFLAAALRMMLPRAASELDAVAVNVILRLLLMTPTACAPGMRTPRSLTSK